MSTLLEKFTQRLRHKGIAGTLAELPHVIHYRWRLWRDGAFDRRYGVDTRGVIDPGNLNAIGEHCRHSHGHEPIQLRVFARIMHSLRIDHSRFVFADFGSGKGRAVLLAAHYPFRQIVGIEFSPALHETACQNFDVLRRRLSTAAPIELRCADVVSWPIPDVDLVCFLYNPFDEVVMQKVLVRLESSYRLRPRRLIVVYRNPQCAHLFEESEVFGLTCTTRDYHVYEAKIPAGGKQDG